MLEPLSAILAKGSMIAALYVVVVFLTGGVTHWFGLVLIPLVIYLGNSTAMGMAAGAFLSSFIASSDPLVLLSAVVGGAASYFATLLYRRLYDLLRRLPQIARMQIAGVAACILITLTDGTRTLLAWQTLFPVTLQTAWAVAFGFSLLSINLLGAIIAIGLGNLLTETEKSRALGRL